MSFAQPVPGEPTPSEYVKEQRKLKSWWDEPTAVNVLKLEAEQVVKLAKLQGDFSAGVKANSVSLKELNKTLGAAILAGEDKKVAGIKKNIVDLISADAINQIEFKIAGLALLNKQQLAGLAASYPDVLDKKWGLRTKGMTRPKGSTRAERGAKHLKTGKDLSEKIDKE